MKEDKLIGLLTLIKCFILGFFICEIFFFSKVIALELYKYIALNNWESPLIYVSAIYFAFITIYLFYRNAHKDLIKVIISKRIDIFLIFVIGILSNYYIGGIGNRFYEKGVTFITKEHLFVILFAPLFLVIAFFLRILQLYFTKKNQISPFFISDIEQKSSKTDLLGFGEIAKVFAERIYNQGSSESLVFGLDAPWGIGKSTLINFCKEYWEQEYKNKVIVYVFNPLRYEDRENLLEKFTDELCRVIRKDIFIPELRQAITKYTKLIKSVKAGIPNFIDLEIEGSTSTAEDAFENLEYVLSRIDKKVIIVIDDLDRLNISSVKDLLFNIKKSFTLPNISFVLCYDAENINSLEKDRPEIDKITEFLEKFVNVKFSLFIDSNKLESFVTKNLNLALSENSQADPILISKAIGGLKDIFRSKQFYKYVPLIGDIRKLKRLINTILLLDIDKTDFDNSDINSHDLIHLLLTYINYPNIFRLIYNTETSDKRGFFSAVEPYDDDYPKEEKNTPRHRDSEYKNSQSYTDYINKLTPIQQFLLNQIFNVRQRLANCNIGSVAPDLKASLACFNGDIWSSGGRNLEDYLKLIVRTSKPPLINQYKKYLNLKNRLLKGEEIENILDDEVFKLTQNEVAYQQFWRLITNSSNQFSREIGSKVITFIINKLPDYSLLEKNELGIGLRDDLTLYLVKLLDQAGWVDQNGEHYHNVDENLSEIAEWILGVGRHSDNGILQILSKNERGITGLYDLLAFRLHCSSDRGGDIFNLSRALAQYENHKALSSGNTKEIAIAEMRIFSQKVYKLFKTNYIDKNKNIFELVEDLNLADLTGQYTEFVEEKIEEGEFEDSEQKISEFKSRMKAFIVYQLGSSSSDFGISCGYYDVEGHADKNDIRSEMNNYLFNICFNPGENKDVVKNYEYFLDYLLINFADVLKSVNKRSYIPNINEFSKVLYKENLRKYWSEHSQKIKSMNYHQQDKKVYAGNYIAFYKEDLLEVYKVLDKLIEENNKEEKH